MSITFNMMKLMMKPYITVVPTPNSCVMKEPSTPLISLLAKTPVSSAPMMPPMPCTPNASRESS